MAFRGTLAQFGAQRDPCIDLVAHAAGEGPVSLVSLANAYTGTQCLRFVIELGHGIPLGAEQIRIAVAAGGC